MADRSVAIRLTTQGKATVVSDLKDIGDAGAASAQRWAREAQQAGDAVAREMARQARANDKIAAITPATATQQIYQAGASTNYDGASARESAANMRMLLAAEDALDAKARALTAVLEPLSVAQDRYNGEVRLAAELHDTGRISLDQFLAAEQRAAIGLEKVAGTAREANVAMRAASTGKSYQAAPDTAFVGKSAASSAAAIEELMAAEDRLAARTNALRASIDPAFAAQQRFDAEIAEARSLVSAGAISLDEYCVKLRQTTAELKHGDDGHRGMSTSGQILQHVVRATTDSMAAGLPVSMILGEQLSRLAEAARYAADEGGGGKLGALAKFLSGPWGLAFTAAVGIASALAPKLFEGADAADVMKEHQQQLAAIIDQTTGRINEQSKALLLNASIMAGKDMKSAQTTADNTRAAILRRGETTYSFGGAPGTPSVENAPDPRIAAAIKAFGAGGSVDQLASRLKTIGDANPGLRSVTDTLVAQAAALTTADRQAQQYAAQQRLLTGQAKPGDQRKALGQFGPEKPDLSLVDAQAKLAAATTKSERAEAQATITRITAKKAYDDGAITIDQYRAKMIAADRAVDAAKTHTDRHAQSLARQAESMEVSARAAIDVANAYLTSSDAGLLAEARRKAATDATRKGISVDEQAARQLAVAAAEQIATAAKAVAAMVDEASARDAVLAKVRDGTVAAEDMDQALKVELALRPLLAARAHLHGAALEVLNRTIDATTAAIERSTAAAGKFDIGKQIEASRQNVLELGAQIEDLAHTPEDAARNAAARAAARASDAAKLASDDPQRMDRYHAGVAEASANYDLNRAKFFQTTLDGQKDSLALSQRELELAGANDNYRTSELDKLRMMLTIQRQFPGAEQARVDAVMRGVAAQDEVNAKLKATQVNMAEVSDVGGKLAETVLSPDTWRNWGEAGRSILKELETEFIKLIALNPIKNMLNGNNNLPTASSLLGSLFGGAKSNGATTTTVGTTGLLAGDDAGHNASGTERWSGGRTWVNENGPEIMDLPQGTRIYPAAESRRMMAANDTGGSRSRLDIRLNTDLFTATVSDTADSRIGIAAPSLVAGGAQMGNTNAARARRRQLGTRG